MRALRADGYRHMPWKNGGGETAEIAIAPTGADVDSFDWRISMARVASDGPFSRFVGIDRTLTIIEGTGLHLSIEGRLVDLTCNSEPFSFRGEATTHATRIDGSVADLNVMTRRDRFTHRVMRLGTFGDLALSQDASIALLFCFSGSLRVESGQQTELLHSLDSLLVRNPFAVLRLSGDSSTRMLLVEISRLDAPA